MNSQHSNFLHIQDYLPNIVDVAAEGDGSIRQNSCHEKETMNARSQARRVMARVTRFRYVCLDFDGVERIGQPFADEIFRVFPLEHPEIDLQYIRANEHVENAIKKAHADAEEMGR